MLVTLNKSKDILELVMILISEELNTANNRNTNSNKIKALIYLLILLNFVNQDPISNFLKITIDIATNKTELINKSPNDGRRRELAKMDGLNKGKE
jgi:hypothetical protein